MALMGISSAFYYTLLGLAISGFIAILFFMFVLWKTPALEFLIAIFGSKSVGLIATRSGRGKFIVGKEKIGVLQTSKQGDYIITEKSAITEVKSGRPIYLAFGEFAATMPLWWTYVTGKIKKKAEDEGNPIANVEDIGGIIGRKYNQDTKAWEKTKPNGENTKIEIMPFETINVHDMVNMFPHSLNPGLVESKTQYQIALRIARLNKGLQQYITAMVILAFIIVLTFLAYKLFGGGISFGGGGLEKVVNPAGNLVG